MATQNPKPAAGRRLKIYGGSVIRGGVQYAAIVAASSQQAAANAADVTVGDIRSYWGETSNAQQVETAMSQPGTVFAVPINARYGTNVAYKPLADYLTVASQ